MQQKPRSIWSDVDTTIGWFGMGIILLAYALVSFGYISADNVFYQSLNLVGAIGLLTISWVKRAYQPAILNLIWALVAIVALVKIF